ncbi:MAG: HAMP domain-containing histidine kinase [Cyanobium sp. Prado107]|nr:HAMP domain-containing histidine kinase [Cyanobium sp. Prado107]
MRGLQPGLVWGLTGLIALLEFATPPPVVFGQLYVIPLLLGASRRDRRQALGFLTLCSALTLLNVVVPQIPADWPEVLVSRLLVCLALGVTTALCLGNRALVEQRVALEVRLAQADLRREVIATLAHDLKTPVLGSIASARLLAGPRTEGDPGLKQRALEAILTSQQRCLRLIDDLLQSFRADQEGLTLRPGPCDPVALTATAMVTVEPIAREREITLLLERRAVPDALRLHADPELLARLLENLMLNALHHSLRGQRVWIALEQQPEGVRIRVSDAGRGFAPEALPHLFERFHPGDSERRGTGLGLYLCRRIVESHGGWIRGRNLPGGGACVEVLLPFAPPPAEGG